MGASPAPSASSGYSYNPASPNDQAPPSTPPYYPAPTSPVVSGAVQNTGAPGSGTSGPPGTPPAGTLGYPSLNPYAGNAAYAGTAESTQAKSITEAGDQNLNAYNATLLAGINKDPSVRMEQAAPQIGAIESQTNQAVKNISTLPRGGAADFLTGNAYISEASQVGDVISQAYNSDLAALGSLGTTEAQLGLSGEQATVNAEATAASITGGELGLKYQQQAANQNAIANDIGALSTLAIG